MSRYSTRAPAKTQNDNKMQMMFKVLGGVLGEKVYFMLLQQLELN